jgi:hypothetical protein
MNFSRSWAYAKCVFSNKAALVFCILFFAFGLYAVPSEALEVTHPITQRVAMTLFVLMLTCGGLASALFGYAGYSFYIYERITKSIQRLGKFNYYFLEQRSYPHCVQVGIRLAYRDYCKGNII